MNKKKYFGVVEGFFSAPLDIWSWKERSKTLDFIEEYAPKINTYLYCPKDAELVTKKPYLLYSETEINQFKDFINRCKKKKIKFIYGLNPSFSEDELNDIEELQGKILMKINQLISIGVKDICLLFDDIPMAYDVFEESATFSEEVSNKIIDLVNGVYNELNSQLNSFWFCSPDYNFKKETNLTQAVKNLNKDIKLFWTGNEIFSKEKTIENIDRAKKISRSDNIVIWDNYPVNDAEQNLGCFNLNGFYPIDNKTLEKVEGVFINPMREPFANLPFYITFSDWIEQRNKYTREDSFSKALNSLGIEQDCSRIIKLFRSYNNFDDETSLISLSEFNLLSKDYKSNDNQYSQLFLNSISQIFKDYQNLLDLVSKIKKGEEITIKLFSKFDWFPTKTNVPRYFNEIVQIVEKRMSLLDPSNDNSVYFKVSRFRNQMNSKYKGKSRLNITKNDEKIILELIFQIIKEEQRLFVEFLNSKSISLEQKFKIFFERRAVNRFSTSP